MVSSCPLPKDAAEYKVVPVPAIGPFTTQHLLLLISGSAALLTGFISYFNIIKHLHRYTEPKQQRQIIRILYFPVVFSVLSAVSIIDYDVAEYMQPLIDLYETFALAGLFLLFVEFVAPDENTRLNYFATLENRKAKNQFRPSKGYTVIPGGCQQWYQRKLFWVFAYVNIDILCTILKLVTEAVGTFCPTSWSPKFFHIWFEVFTNIFLSLAITSIVYFYMRFAKEPDFAQHKSGLKLISFKATVAVNFLQSIIFSSISVDTSAKFTMKDWRLGVPAAVVAVEQIFFATFFHYSFRSREYHEDVKGGSSTTRLRTLRAAANALNPTDLLFNMFNTIRLLPVIFSKSGKSSAAPKRYQKLGDDSHLEPMTQNNVPFINAPQHVHQNSDYSTTEYQPQAYSPPAGAPPPPEYEHYGDDRSRLNPYAYGRTHSRDSSVDGTETRSTRQMV